MSAPRGRRAHLALPAIGAMLAASGCVSPHDVLRRADYRDAAERTEHARYAAEVAGDPGYAPALRAHAFEVLGKLRHHGPDVARALGAALDRSGTAERVRAEAVWALGEIGRELPWSEDLKALHARLLDALRDDPSPTVAYYLLEALGKYYPTHRHSFEENERATKALQAFAASRGREPPGLYYVVLNRITSLEVMVELLDDAVTQAQADGGRKALLEVYGSTLTLMRFFEEHRRQLVASFDERRETIERAFERALDGLELQQRMLTLMLTWYLARVAEEPAFAQIVADEVAAEADRPDPTVRMMVAWSLAHLDTAASARRTLRRGVLEGESNARVLRVMHEAWTSPEDSDLLQRLHDVAPKGSGSGEAP